MKASSKKTAIISVSISSALIIFLAANYLIWKNNYQDRFYPGEGIGNTRLSGLTKDQAKQVIGERFDNINKAGLSFYHEGMSKRLDLDVVSFDSDLARPVLSFDLEKSLAIILNSGNHNSFWYYLKNYLIKKERKEFAPVYTLNNGAVGSFLKESFEGLSIPPANAYFSVTGDDSEKKLTANQERLGKDIDSERLFNDLENSLAKLEVPVITVKTISIYPEIKQSDLSGLEQEAKNIIDRGEIIIRFEELGRASSTIKYWKIKTDRLAGWLSVDKSLDKYSISLDIAKIKTYIETEISPAINQEAVLPRFEIKNNKVSSWQAGKSGRQVDLDKSADIIAANIINGVSETSLILQEVPAQDTEVSNDLQIKEILGTGYSRFAGSPTNRRKNIKNGADTLHGILIKPGEEFSLIKTLGEIDASTGYFPELVIKGNKTVPEFGGGLCQIGTTIFRTALASGLPITMRRNHSYRVSYYEPAGTDATIYDPLPDMRFLNDTGNYILIQARINGDDLFFDFWGTKDGRIATTTYPTIYNIVAPPPTKIIETTELKPGERKCTESSHNGADAFFDYKVTYPEWSTSTPIEKRFTSHYIPWQGVCLVGASVSSTTPIKQ